MVGLTESDAELEELRRIAAAARRLVALLDAEVRAQSVGQQDGSASPGRSAPPRAAVVDAQCALREAVHGTSAGVP